MKLIACDLCQGVLGFQNSVRYGLKTLGEARIISWDDPVIKIKKPKEIRESKKV